MSHEIFVPPSPVERENEVNNNAHEELRIAIHKGLVFAFIGSGCSIDLDYPSWDTLLARMEMEVKKHNPEWQEKYDSYKNEEDRDLLWFAQILKNAFPMKVFITRS